MDCFSELNVQKLEINCSKKLSSFINKFNQCANSLKEHVVELGNIANGLLAMSQQLEKLENTKSVAIFIYFFF